MKDFLKTIGDNKTFSNLFNFAEVFLKFLPILFIVGILYQFISLLGINKLIFFSWTQVINDSVVLFFPVLFGILGIVLGEFIKTDSFKSFLIDGFLFSIIAFVIFTSFYGIFGRNLLSEIFIVGFILSLFIKIYTYINIDINDKIKHKNLKIIFMVLSFIFLFSFIRENQYKNLYINIEGNLTKIIYFNDKYIFFENKIISNTESLEFINK